MSDRVPSYRCKKVQNRKYGVVSLPDGAGGRRDVLLGRWGTKESKLEYSRVLAEWQAADRRLPRSAAGPTPDLSINEVLIRYLAFAERHYRYADGTPTNELADTKVSLRPLRQFYGHTPAAGFGPLALEAIREQMITQPITTKLKVVDAETGKVTWQEKVIRTGLARGVINQRIHRIRRMFRWAVSKELVPPSVLQALETVRGLQRGRSDARETERIAPVSEALVLDTLPHLTPTVADLVMLQLLTGARSGEVCIIRACDLDTSGPIWLYRPRHHKTLHLGRRRVIAIGPRGQEIVRRHMKANVEAYLFSPAGSRELRFQEMRAARKSPVQPSQVNRKKARPRRVPGERYRPGAIAVAVRRACRKAGLPHWHPHQLRHTKATEIRRTFGLEAAQATLGHSQANVTQIYAERDLGLAVEVARKLG